MAKPGLPVGRAILYLLSSILVLTTGCHTLTYTSPTGERFTRTAFGNNTTIGELIIRPRTNGPPELILKNYANDQVEFAERITRAAVEAALKSAVPTP